MLQCNEKIIKHKVGLPNLAEELGNVSKACQRQCQSKLAWAEQGRSVAPQEPPLPVRDDAQENDNGSKTTSTTADQQPSDRVPEQASEVPIAETKCRFGTFNIGNCPEMSHDNKPRLRRFVLLQSPM